MHNEQLRHDHESRFQEEGFGYQISGGLYDPAAANTSLSELIVFNHGLS